MKILNFLFLISIAITIIFYFFKKKFLCFLFSAISTFIFFLDAMMNQNWFGMLFWGAGFLFDIYMYKKDSWDLWGHFDD